MAIPLTTRTQRALRETGIEPNIIVRFEGLDTLFSAQPVQEFINIGDPDLFVGDSDFFIGGLRDVDPSINRVLVDSEGTSFRIQQQINHDEGKSSSVSSMTVGLVDKDQYVTLLISPGQLIEDILGRKAQIFVTYGVVSFFEDALEVFKGFVTTVDSGTGVVRFKLNHPETKKKVNLFKTFETRLDANINATQTTITVEDGSVLLEPSGPLTTYLRIGAEIIQYTTVTGNTITGITRGVLGSTAAPASTGDQVRALYALEDNPLELALQLMMSGHGTDPIYENIPVTHFLKIGSSPSLVANAVYFEAINLSRDYGLRAGDTVTITGASNGANNVTRTVTDVVRANSGFYAVLDGAPLVLEEDSSAVMDTFTQFNTLPDGMRMKPDEVDIDQHERLRDFFFSSTQMRFYIKEDEIDGKQFLDEQLYKPIACYALPRLAKTSVGYTVGPIPGEDIRTLDLTNIKDPRQLRITRGSARSFFNEVVYKYDDTPLVEDEKYTSGAIVISQTSKNRIPGVNRTYEIESQGLRTDLNAQNIVASNAQRILDRYQFAAEIITASALLRDTAGLEIGDIVVIAFNELQMSDISRGDRQFEPRLFEVLNKTLSLKTGDVELSLLDTGLNLDSRFGLMSPTSPISGVISQSQFVIAPDSVYGSRYGLDEYREWENIINISNPMSVRIHNADYSIDEDLVVTGVSENTFTLDTPASITLTAGLLVEFTDYADADTSDKQKLVYGYMTDDPAFADGGNPYIMI